MTTIYGINNCDTVKKALKWLNTNNIEFTFHDFRKDGLTEEQLNQFVEMSDWQLLMNKRSTSFRNLDDNIKQNLSDENCMFACLEQPTLIKRPVLIHNNQLFVGFKDKTYQEIFACE